MIPKEIMDMDIRELVAEEDLFDPFADDIDEDEADEDGQPLIGAPLEERGEEDDTLGDRPARERIADLLQTMPNQKRMLLRLIDFCREEKSGEEMDGRTEELRQYCFSVYTPVVFRELLEKAGAIRYLTPEGYQETAVIGDSAVVMDTTVSEPLREDGDRKIVHEGFLDGDEEVEIDFLEIEDSPPGVWIATPEGLEAVDGQDDRDQTKKLLDKESQYLNIYQQILDFCTEERGRSSKEIDMLVNDNPLLVEPRRFSGYFVGRLERKGALEWKGGWVTTEVGESVLNEIAS